MLAFLYAYIQTFVIVKLKFSFAYTAVFYKIYFVHLILGIVAFLITKFFGKSI
jgi:hypothetical protein